MSECANVLPVSAIKSQGIQVQTAELIVKQAKLANFKVGYSDTMQQMLSNETLNKWVREEILCQQAQAFEKAAGKAWYYSMRSVAKKGSSDDLMEFLNKHPNPKSFQGSITASDTTKKNSQKSTKDQDQSSKDSSLLSDTITIGTVSGYHVIPKSVNYAEVHSIDINGTLRVPGAETTVFVGHCGGTIEEHPDATVVVRESDINCSQEEMWTLYNWWRILSL